MARKCAYTKEMILEAAIKLFKKEGSDAITAKNIAKELNCSVAPIYSVYLSLDDLKKDLAFEIEKNILEEMDKAHVENAIIRGVSKKRIILNHLLRNTSIPIITVLSSNIMYLLTGSVLIEEIFAWPGIGKLFTTAVKTGDFPLIQICLLFFGIMSIIVNEFTQALVKYMDPRLRIKEKSKAGGVL